MAAELGPQRRVDLGGVVALTARLEAGEQRGRQRRLRDAALDGVLERPPALAAVLDVGLEALEVVALLLEGARGQRVQPRAHDRALLPQVGDLRVVDAER